MNEYHAPFGNFPQFAEAIRWIGLCWVLPNRIPS